MDYLYRLFNFKGNGFFYAVTRYVVLDTDLQDILSWINLALFGFLGLFALTIGGGNFDCPGQRKRLADNWAARLFLGGVTYSNLVILDHFQFDFDIVCSFWCGLRANNEKEHVQGGLGSKFISASSGFSWRKKWEWFPRLL